MAKDKIKLNALQARTLALLQALAEDDGASTKTEDGGVTISQFPHAHGDHLHVGGLVVSNRFASGLRNEAVWVALSRKGLARDVAFPLAITLTPQGLAHDTGLIDKISEPSDH